jgi:hypothetical protein
VSLNETYEALTREVNFFCIYTQEAHPQDWWPVESNLDDDVVFYQPKSLDERANVARACVLRLDITMPTLLDDMENSTDAAYAAMPERLYVIDQRGRVAYQSRPGPWGFDIDEWRNAIQETVGVS